MDTNRVIAPSGNDASITDMPGVTRELHIQLQRYIEAQYPIRHGDVVAERHALLEESGIISQEPFIESMPGYTSGPRYNDLALPPLLVKTLEELASSPSPLLPQQLYEHQAQALEMFLGHDRDLIVVTGTGSGKTETFLLPVLLRSVLEASTRPQSFRLPGMRALLLYPMNALVNDQLTRLRLLFGNGQLATLLRQHTTTRRSVRFGMYTSRTPYPGIMSKEKNARQLLPLLDYYLQLEADPSSHSNELKARGHWPALHLHPLRTAAGEGNVLVRDDDYELYTRHQIQQWCPDILITNYSMLEYMLMRPIEQTIFQQTATWLAQDNTNTLLVVLDEAHLYSGVTGAEIALLLRRLQARLGISRERVRYILTSASLDVGEQGQSDITNFATTLVGTRAQKSNTFAIIEGKRSNPPPIHQSHSASSIDEVAALAAFRLADFTNRVAHPDAGDHALRQLATNLHWPQPPASSDLTRYLGAQLPQLYAFQRLWHHTSEGAVSFSDLAQELFTHADERTRSLSTSVLLSLAAAAITLDNRPLLPIRAHLFFRGLPQLYACINPHCSARRVSTQEAQALGALWLSPRLHCVCGSRVYELYAHRNCGTLFLRAFPSGETGEFYWHEPGRNQAKATETLLLVGSPHPKANDYEPVDLHIMTGRAFLQANHFQTDLDLDFIRVYRPTAKKSVPKGKKQQDASESDADTQHWKSCPVCRKRLHNSITSLSTKGEQPFVNLVRRQFELQPPSTTLHETTPNMGRKVLLFSDGRQRAARLARDLPREVELDTFRQALLLAVARRKHQTQDPLVRMDQALYSEFVGVCAHYHLYFFDGEDQKTLLKQIRSLQGEYGMDTQAAIEDEWDPEILSMYRLALLRQVADPFYSMQRMCAAVIEPRARSLKRLKRNPLFARLADTQLRALTTIWIEELLEESAFDKQISPHDRENTVPGSGFAYNPSTSWNDAEKAAEVLLSYTNEELQLLRQALVDEFCSIENERAFLNPEKLALRLTIEESWYQCQDCMRLIWLPLNNTCPNQRCGSPRLLQLPGDDVNLRARTDFYREPIRQVINGSRDPRHLTAEEHTAQLSYRDRQQVSTTTEEYELRFQDIGLSTDHPSIDILSCTTTMEVGIDIGSLLGIGLRTMPPRRANYQQRAGRAGRRSSVLSTVLTYSENGSHDAHYFTHPKEMISGKLLCPQISPINERLTQRHIQAALIQTFFLEQIHKMSTMSTRQYGYLTEALGMAYTFFTTTGATSLSGFEQWLQDALAGSEPRLMPHISAWLPTQLGTKWLNEEEKQAFVLEVATRFVKRLSEIAIQFFPASSSQQEEKQAFDILGDERLLDILFEHDFLPTYAFPREVRSFVIEQWKQERSGKRYIGIEQRPQQSVDIALSEYVPGRELIVDKATYRVGGIYVDPFPGATLATRVPSLFQKSPNLFALCMNCGYTLQKETSPSVDQEGGQRCPLCNTTLTIKEILDPPGFAPEGARKLEPSQFHTSTSTQVDTTTQVKLILPPSNTDSFHMKTASQQITWNKAEHRQLLIINSGNGNDGFSVCRSCGAAAPGDPLWLQKSHDRPFHIPGWISAPKKCSVPEGIWHGYFGHLFSSDLLILRLQWPQGVAYELGVPWMRDAFDTFAQGLLLAATRLLDVSTSELQTGWTYTVTAQENTSTPISTKPTAYFFLFDTLSGGAGYATQIGVHIDQLLQKTQDILDNCPGQCEQSCYRCLRTYQNRLFHHHLDRHLAGTLLHAIVSGQIPGALSIARQRENLVMLRHYLDLTGQVECLDGKTVRGVEVPLLIKAAQQTLALGVYPIQQDRKAVKHALDALPKNQVRLFSDYELAHNLPSLAHTLL